MGQCGLLSMSTLVLHRERSFPIAGVEDFKGGQFSVGKRRLWDFERSGKAL